ncbi:hypothetical protein SAMN05443248_3537 [Bradyrhizobium erythrophlei]|uniref:Uncharacterized protein n=1 Tax=Bradyrhizobium erythrophlei TaxID=1437360 RepID=A0A1M5PWJ5_9BRAD|nr:hypothetical protein SAMN05443248_3537 [Bradyrhizobium erythrophlei]
MGIPNKDQGSSKTESTQGELIAAQLLEQERKANAFRAAGLLLMLGISAPMWVPGVFILWLILKIFVFSP